MNKNLILLSLALFGVTTLGKAQTAGTFNTTFGTNGLVTTDIGYASNYAYKELIQPDGKIVLIGNNDTEGIILRYNTNGTLDTTFNGTGKLFSNYNYFESGALQSDGKIIVCTQQDVMRYNSDGTLDTTFGNNGVYRYIGPSGIYFGIRNIAVQIDGKIVIAGNEYDNLNINFAALRLNSNGTIDTSFNGTGKVTKDINQYDDIRNVIIQTDGKIILAGDTQLNPNVMSYVAIRYNANGSIDSIYGVAGVANINDGSSNKLAGAAIQNDGKLILTGTSSYDVKTVRLNTNGTLDTTFNGTGRVITSLATDETKSVAIQADGKIVVAGYKYDSTLHTSEFFLIRYNTNGALDTTFNSTGVVLASINKNKPNKPCDVKIQTDGKIVVGGTSYLVYNNDIAVMRFNSNGTLDTTFNGTGKLTSGILTSGRDELQKLAVQSDGKILAAGYSATDNLSIVRYNSNGTLDNTFNNNGIVKDNFFHLYYGNPPKSSSVLSQTNGKVILVGSFLNDNTNTNDIFVRRYNANGSIDNTFGNSGIAVFNINNNWTYANSAVLQSDGKILVLGETYRDTTNALTLIRFNSNGTLDSTFNGTGFLSTGLPANSEGNSIVVQPDGKILAGGWINNGFVRNLLLVRYNSNGSFDNTFNGNGIVTQSLGADENVILKLALQSDGKIVALSSYENASGSTKLALLRFSGNGSLDTSFNFSGILLTDYSGISYPGYNDLVLDSLNRMIVSTNDNRILRYNVNGNLDSTFGDDGNVVNKFYAGTLLVANNHLITGGSDFSDNNYSLDYALSSINLYNVGIVGTFNDWGGTADVSMSSTDGINFTVSNQTFSTTEVRFRENNSWNLNWGGSTFPTGTGLSNGSNIVVPAGTYTVKFNIVSGDYSFTKVLGTADSDKRATFSFAPNPAKEKIIFNEDIKTVEIYALDGKKLNVTYINKEANVSTLPKGIYIIKATSSNGDIMSKKLIKE